MGIEVLFFPFGEYPHLEVLPVCANYEQPFSLPSPTKPVMRRVAYYPGSTIGQSHPHEAIEFLKQVREVCSPNASLLIGVDLKKEVEIPFSELQISDTVIVNAGQTIPVDGMIVSGLATVDQRALRCAGSGQSRIWPD